MAFSENNSSLGMKMSYVHFQGIKQDILLEDETGKTLEAMHIFTESIKYLKDHFLKNIESQGMEFKDSEILYVLTVPAIWNDSAKQFMRNAALQVS